MGIFFLARSGKPDKIYLELNMLKKMPVNKAKILAKNKNVFRYIPRKKLRFLKIINLKKIFNEKQESI